MHNPADVPTVHLRFFRWRFCARLEIESRQTI